MTIPLYEDFSNPLGQYLNYDIHGNAAQAALNLQKHVDIRSFRYQTNVNIGYTMFELDQLTIADLDGLTMSNLENQSIVLLGEHWTNAGATVGPQSDRHNLPGLSLTCTAGSNNTASTMLTAPIDISGLAPGDSILISCPAYPNASITAASSFLDLSSDSAGSFAGAGVDNLAFSTATTDIVGGDRGLYFPISALTHVDKTKITAVRLRINTTGNATFRCMAIRAVSANWTYAAMDINTQNDLYAPTVPPSGSLAEAITFPTATSNGLFFTDGADGPMMNDIEVGTVIHTGSNLLTNQFVLYLRAFPCIPYKMSDLESMTMAQIEALLVQPDFAPAPITSIGHDQYITVTVQWGQLNQIEISDKNGSPLYGLPNLGFTANSDFYMLTTLLDHSIRVQTFPIDVIGNIDFTLPLFDSTEIFDPLLCVRRPGRLGWYAAIEDGNSYIKNIRPRRTVYHEYRSAPFVTQTPTVGTQLFATGSPDKELYNGAVPENGAKVSLDVRKSTSGKCLAIQTTGGAPLQGLSTDPLRFENFEFTEINFSVLAPSSVRLSALLLGEERILDLFIPPYPANRWTPVRIPLRTLYPVAQPGAYALLIVQTENTSATWYIDDLSIVTRSVAWQGRQDTPADPPWLSFGDAINQPYDGLLVGRDNQLQVRGLVMTQDGSIDRIKILPQYAELGNLVWDAEIPVFSPPPIARIIWSKLSEFLITVDPTTSTAANGIAAYHWSWGDGTEEYSSGAVRHTYALTGTYTLTLTVIDDLGLQDTASRTFNIV